VTGRRVVLTGRGVVSPLGVGLASHWEAMSDGRSAVDQVSRIAALGLSASRGAVVTPETIQPHLGRVPRKQQKLYNRTTLLAMIAAVLAMEDAGLNAGAGDPERFGVLLGVNVLGWDLAAMTEYLAAAEARHAPGTLDMTLANAFCMRSINPLDFSLKTLPNLAAGHLAIAHEARGFCRAITDGPIGGLRAVGDAWRLVAEGDLDVALAGGADAQLEEVVTATYEGAGFFARDDGSRPGQIPGEGSGLLVLEDAERAAARGARVHGRIAGFAVGAGEGLRPQEDDPGRRAVRLASVIEDALDEAGARPDLVCLHGDGVPTHDETERRALALVLGAGGEAIPRLSGKRLHGDLGAAAGPVELLACSAALEDARLRATMAPRHALIVSLGFFGEAAALVLRGPGGEM